MAASFWLENGGPAYAEGQKIAIFHRKQAVKRLVFRGLRHAHEFFLDRPSFPVAFKNRLGHIAVVAANNNAAAPRSTDYPRTEADERV
ncbi:hypothetical protein [Pararhizobium sp.]|uniref:hypothetical protein n=1 Tax=Pararhizobium sp. TaxID=1977563 RepID=UPI003BAAA6FF